MTGSVPPITKAFRPDDGTTLHQHFSAQAAARQDHHPGIQMAARTQLDARSQHTTRLDHTALPQPNPLPQDDPRSYMSC
jgi:hypothetical protein